LIANNRAVDYLWAKPMQLRSSRSEGALALEDAFRQKAVGPIRACRHLRDFEALWKSLMM
jgi:hypothetical protein